jgi:hypothetical protein
LFLYAAELAEVDPESPKYAALCAAVSCFKDFDLAINPIIEADILARSLLVDNSAQDDVVGPSQAGWTDPIVNLKDEDGQDEFLYPVKLTLS